MPLALRSKTVASSTAVTKPAGLALDDLIVVTGHVFTNGATPDISGFFTAVRSATGGASPYSISWMGWKFADAGDIAGSGWTITGNNAGYTENFARAYTGADTTNPIIDAKSGAGSGGTGPPTIASMTPVNPNGEFLFASSGQGGINGAPSGFTSQDAAGAGSRSSTKAYTTVAASGTVSTNDLFAPWSAVGAVINPASDGLLVPSPSLMRGQAVRRAAFW